MLPEPITYFYNKLGFDPKSVKNIVFGKKYCAVVLKNGQIGVCATLNHQVEIDFASFPDLTGLSDRIILNAYFNAVLNYENLYSEEKDIFDKIDFGKYKNIVMTGYFRSLTEKFRNQNISLTIFDLESEEDEITPLNLQPETISKADALILTSTSIFNDSLQSLIKYTQNQCDIYLLGPSTLMHPDLFKFGNIKYCFGSLFEKNDQRVLKIIKEGGGTSDFSKFMRKVFLKRK